MTESTSPAKLDVHAFALALVQPLCDEPGEAAVCLTDAERDATCVITVSPNDFARLSSGRGRTVRSLGTVLGAATAKLGTHCSLDLRSGR